MSETFEFIELGGERLFAALHAPDRPTSSAVIMCHPLGEEKLWSHRVFVSFARDLASAGFLVLRFDFRGEGDSDREFEEADFESRIADARLAVDFIRRSQPSVTEITLMGLRLGASVAAAAATRVPDVRQLLLWDPVVDGEAYMQSFLRLNLMYQMSVHRRVVENRDALVARLAGGDTVNIEGYELANALFQQVSAFRLPDVLASFRGQTDIVQITQGDVEVRTDLAQLADTIPGCRIRTATEEPFWKEIKTLYQRAANLTEVSLIALQPARPR